jgi:hypothetical protein
MGTKGTHPFRGVLLSPSTRFSELSCVLQRGVARSGGLRGLRSLLLLGQHQSDEGLAVLVLTIAIAADE